jgi:hypothetical protein
MKRPGLSALLVLAVAAVGAMIILVASLVTSAGPEVPVRLNPEERDPLLRVAGKEITRFHLNLARQHQKLRGGYQMPDFGFIREMLERAAGEEILRKYGRALTPQDIVAERARMERDSRDRETQRKVIHLLDQYPGMFEMLVVRPALVNNRLHDLQVHDRTIQKEAFEKAEAGLKEALRDADYFRRMKQEAPERYARIDSRVAPGPENGPPQPPEMREQHNKAVMDWTSQYLSRVSPGEIKPEPLDSGGAMLVLRMIERDESHVVYEQVAFPKIGFDAWLDSELKGIKAEVVDPAIRGELKQGLKDSPYGRWLFPD